MLEYSIVEPGGILRVKPAGELTTADFGALTQFVDSYLNEHGRLVGLLIEAQSFPGWNSFAALASHIRFVRDHQRHIERVALVTDSSIAHVAKILVEPFAAAAIRCFAFDHYDEAMHWLRSDRRAEI